MKRTIGATVRLGIFSLLLVLSAMAGVFASFTPSASADSRVEPGCYQQLAATGKYQTVTCPEDKKAGQADGKCYVAVNVSDEAAKSYNEKPCTDIQTSDIASEEICEPTADNGCDTEVPLSAVNGDCGDKGQCITDLIMKLVNALTVGVGVIVTISIIVSGIQYTLSRDNPQTVQAAKARIVNAVIALIAYVFVFAFLQWIVPGGAL